MTAYLSSHALTLAAVVACLLLLARRSGARRTPQSTFAWLLAFALVPVLAIPLYLALGSRKAFCGGTSRADGERRAAPASQAGDARVQFVPSGPDMTTDTMYDAFLNGIFGARERVALVTPYYVPDEALQHALLLAARRGVKTEVVVPAWSNHRIADLARRDLLRELRRGGVVIHHYTRGMVHAKAMVIDEAFAYVGSPNFDMRSLFLNYEDALCLYSSDAIASVRGFVDELISQCAPEAPIFPEHRLLEQIALLLAPEL